MPARQTRPTPPSWLVELPAFALTPAAAVAEFASRALSVLATRPSRPPFTTGKRLGEFDVAAKSSCRLYVPPPLATRAARVAGADGEHRRQPARDRRRVRPRRHVREHELWPGRNPRR